MLHIQYCNGLQDLNESSNFKRDYTIKIYPYSCLNYKKRNSPRGLFLFQQFVDFFAEVGVMFLQTSGDKQAG